MLFSRERVGVKITLSKLSLMVDRVQCYFPRKSKTKNHLVKNRVNRSQGTMLFSKEREKQKVTLLKIELTILRVQ